MARQDYYSYSKTYEYNIEIPYEGAIAEGIPDARTLVGEITWNGEALLNDKGDQYEAEMYWEDHENQFSQDGNGPKEDEFIDDFYAYMESQGIASEDVTY